MKKGLLLVYVTCVATAAGGLVWLISLNDPKQEPPGLSVTELVELDAHGFLPVETPWRFSFPADHGAHPHYQTESWHFSGNLATSQGRRFGFQLTFLRVGLRPPGAPQRSSAWATRELYRGYFAVSDVAEGKFYPFERLTRAALGLGGAQMPPIRIWVENWSVELVEGNATNPSFDLQAAAEDIRIALSLKSTKAVVHPSGGNTNQSRPFHFYVVPRMSARGTIQVRQHVYSVEGLAWLDRAWGAVPLPQGQLVWDRFLLQLDDRSEIMCLRLRRRDGSGQPISTGLLVRPNGSLRSLSRDELTVEILEHWESPRGGFHYPARWRFRVPSEELELDITPYVADQEIDLSARYWSGAAGITGKARGRRIQGSGHVELLGYAEGKPRF